MNWSVLGGKGYGHMTDLQRQASKCTFGQEEEEEQRPQEAAAAASYHTA